jgi:Spy/CpxP family protein refolding chaperone
MVQRHVDVLTNRLGLSPAQQQQASTIFTNQMASAKSMHEQMRTAHQNLSTAVKNNDSVGIEQAAQTIGNLTSQSISAHAKAEAAFYQTLTPDQQSKFAEMRERMPGMLMFRRPHSF